MNPTIAHCVRKSTQLRLSFIFNQIVHLRNFNVVIVFLSLPKDNDSGFAQFDLSKYNHFFSGKNRNFFQKLIFRYFKLIGKKESRSIAGFLKEQNVQALHLHFGTDASIYSHVVSYSGLPSIVSFYGYDCSSFPSRFMGSGKIILRRRVFKLASSVLAMSPEMKSDLLSLGCPEEKIIIHYYGTDVQKFYVECRNSRSGGRIRLLTAGRLDEKKGHLFLIKALEELNKENQVNLEWIIAGDGKQKNKIIHHVEVSGLMDVVKMIGSFTYNSDTLTQLFSEADIYIQPSITADDGDKEGIPWTLVEAMAAGLPVISTVHSGIPSIVEDGVTGMLVSEWDVEAMKKTIMLLWNDSYLRSRLGKEAQRFAMENLDLKMKEIELEKIYDLILNRRQNIIL